ncbi:hypothetical protein [Trichormus azollae]|jgi:tRNA(fMet)-specific endonuclease VapC|uniref:hypothetical protein n=1 Tax=Trichormus azollae TaxID=1164 RepID=UPI00019586BC|nr:hypothetical protein [Trichormus azollae]
MSYFSPNISAYLLMENKLELLVGGIRAELSKLRTPIGAYDFQVAAIALANNLILVTHNTREFDRIENLKIEDWEENI